MDCRFPKQDTAEENMVIYGISVLYPISARWDVSVVIAVESFNQDAISAGFGYRIWLCRICRSVRALRAFSGSLVQCDRHGALLAAACHQVAIRSRRAVPL
jgi:hypothetical protein